MATKERILNNLPISKQATILGCTFENSNWASYFVLIPKGLMTA